MAFFCEYRQRGDRREVRTAAWLGNLLVGREEHIRPLIESSVIVESAHYLPKTSVLSLKIRNHSDATFQLNNESDYTFTRFGEVIELPPHETTTIEIRTVTKLEIFELPTAVLNVLVAPKTPLSFTLSSA